jgi:hypothetical protein
MKSNKKSKGKNIRVSDEFHQELKDYVSPLFKIGAFIEDAVREKIDQLKLKKNGKSI